MKAIEFPQANEILAKDQPQYQPLPVHIDTTDPSTPFTVCFELSDEEINEIVRTRKLWHTQVTFGQRFHPIMMTTQNPFVNQEQLIEHA